MVCSREEYLDALTALNELMDEDPPELDTDIARRIADLSALVDAYEQDAAGEYWA